MWRAGIYNSIKIKSVSVIPARHSFSLTRLKTRTLQPKEHANDFASMLELSSNETNHKTKLDYFLFTLVIGKRGMQVTWIGFASNVGLTVSKGTAGWSVIFTTHDYLSYPLTKSFFL